jgi:hypothetical protein
MADVDNKPSITKLGLLGLVGAAAVVVISALVAFRTDPSQALPVSNFWFGIQATGAFLTALAILAAFIQVKETKRQLSDNRNWNKMSFALTFLPSFEMFFEWEKELDNTFVKLIQRNQPLSQDEVNRLFLPENVDTNRMLKTYMNALEAYCVAINTGLASAEVAEKVFGYKLVVHYKELAPYIKAVRDKHQNQAIFGELETVCRKWAPEIPSPNPTY